MPGLYERDLAAPGVQQGRWLSKCSYAGRGGLSCSCTAGLGELICGCKGTALW